MSLEKYQATLAGMKKKRAAGGKVDSGAYNRQISIINRMRKSSGLGKGKPTSGGRTPGRPAPRRPGVMDKIGGPAKRPIRPGSERIHAVMPSNWREQSLRPNQEKLQKMKNDRKAGKKVDSGAYKRQISVNNAQRKKLGLKKGGSTQYDLKRKKLVDSLRKKRKESLLKTADKWRTK